MAFFAPRIMERHGLQLRRLTHRSILPEEFGTGISTPSPLTEAEMFCLGRKAAFGNPPARGAHSIGPMSKGIPRLRTGLPWRGMQPACCTTAIATRVEIR